MLEVTDVDFPTPSAPLLVCGYLETPALLPRIHHQNHPQPGGSCQGLVDQLHQGLPLHPPSQLLSQHLQIWSAFKGILWKI